VVKKVKYRRGLSTLAIALILVAILAGVIATIYSIMYVKRSAKTLPPQLVSATAEFEYNKTAGTVKLVKLSFVIKNPTVKNISVISIYVNGFGSLDYNKASSLTVEPPSAGTVDRTKGIIIYAGKEATVTLDGLSLEKSLSDLESQGITLDELEAGVGPYLTVVTDAGSATIQIHSFVVTVG